MLQSAQEAGRVSSAALVWILVPKLGLDHLGVLELEIHFSLESEQFALVGDVALYDLMLFALFASPA